jgi:hypothetical protein
MLRDLFVQKILKALRKFKNKVYTDGNLVKRLNTLWSLYWKIILKTY